MRSSILKLIFAALTSIYFLSIAYAPIEGSFLDMVDLPIHETGHLVFRIFGEFMGIAGGTLFQLIVPAVFVGYFVWQKSYYSAVIVMMWVGQSILNVWIYASDAVVMQLMLTSGMTGAEGGFHDWNYMLDAMGLLNSTRTIAGIIRFAGTIVILASVVSAFYFAFVDSDEEIWEP
jgi:hypothetical protein